MTSFENEHIFVMCTLPYVGEIGGPLSWEDLSNL